MKRSPIKSKRETPRRAEGRIQHGRIKERTVKAPSAAERRHMDRIARMGCLVCQRPATIHHVTSDGYARITRSHALTAPLCPVHHQITWGPKESVEALGHAGFTAAYGIDLLKTAQSLWEESCRIDAG